MKKTLIIIIICIFVIGISIAIFFLSFPKKYLNIIDEYSEEFGVEKYLVSSVINIESGYRKDSVSNAGAVGLMQLLPSTAFDMAERLDIKITEKDLFNEDVNIKIGCYYLSYLLEMFDNNITNTLCAYNWGLTNVKNWIFAGNVDDNGTITSIPVKETEDYIKKFSVNKFVYKNLYKF